MWKPMAAVGTWGLNCPEGFPGGLGTAAALRCVTCVGSPLGSLSAQLFSSSVSVQSACRALTAGSGSAGLEWGPRSVSPVFPAGAPALPELLVRGPHSEQQQLVFLGLQIGRASCRERVSSPV